MMKTRDDKKNEGKRRTMMRKMKDEEEDERRRTMIRKRRDDEGEKYGRKDKYYRALPGSPNLTKDAKKELTYGQLPQLICVSEVPANPKIQGLILERQRIQITRKRLQLEHRDEGRPFAGVN